jgi:hypothetical protein
MSDWRKEWEWHADAEQARHDAMGAAELLANVCARRWGDYHTIWYAIAKRADLADAAWPLFSILESNAEYLDRYHCAAALLQLLGCSDWEPVELSATRFPLADNLARLRSMIVARIGEP